MMNKPCDGCPFGEKCHAFKTKHARFCAPQFRDYVADKTNNPDQPRPEALLKAGTVIVRGHANSYTGYGQHTTAMAKEIERAGYPVVWEAIDRDDSFVSLDPWVSERITKHIPKALPRFISTAPNQPHDLTGCVVLTMWESTRLKPEWVANLNRAKAVLVPCQWCLDLFRDSGVTVPLRIVPLGYYPAVFHPTIGEPEGRAVFGCAGRTSHGGSRKGLEQVAKAFLDAFPVEQDVRLEVKIWPDCQFDYQEDPRIVVNREPLTDAGLADWYRSLSVFVSASKSEGWGLQPLQAMACGRPVVATHYGGHGVYMTDGTTYPVSYHEEAVPDGYPIYGGLGDWSIPDHNSLVSQLRAAYLDPAGRREKGRAAAIKALDYTWEIAGGKLIEALREFDLVPPSLPSIQPPNLIQRAGNLITAVSKQVAAGNPLAPPDVQARRKAECESCPHYTANHSCKLCGCVAMDLKRSWETSVCPDGRW